MRERKNRYGIKRRRVFIIQIKQMPLPEDLALEVKDLVKSCLADGKLDSGEILRIGVFVAEKANGFLGMSGVEKKAFVLRVVKEAVVAAVPPEQVEKVGSTAALSVLPAVLDIAIQAARGKFALEKVSAAAASVAPNVLERVRGCFSSFLRSNRCDAFVDVLKGLKATVQEPVVAQGPAVSQEPVVPAAPVPKTVEIRESVPPSQTPADKDVSPEKAPQAEPSPVASDTASPELTHPPEEPAKELPNMPTQ